MRQFCAAVMFLTLVVAWADEPGVRPGVGEEDPAIDALFAHWDQPGSPGCAVAISDQGELIYSRGFGFASLDYDIPITPATIFDVASVTKQFVAASLSMLELDGRLSFEDDVRQYLPELPVYEDPVTLHHMVYHTSGLRDYLNLFPLAGRNDYTPISHQQILDMMARQRALNFAPGERYEYSNTAYMLLAQVVQRVSDQSLASFVSERIFTPLGMIGSLMYDNHERIIPRRAIGYARSDDDLRMTHNFNFDVPGDGQMYTTVEDLIRWDDYLHGDPGPEYYETIMQEGTLNTGVKLARAKGLFLDEYRGARTIHHTGSSWGFRTVVKRFVDARLAIAIACNDDNAYPRGIAFRIADYLLADELAALPVGEESLSQQETGKNPVPPDAAPLLRLSAGQRLEFAGSYYSPELDAIYRFSVSGENVQVSIEQEQAVLLRPVVADRFNFEFQPQGWDSPETVELDFARDKDGRVSGFLLSASAERDIVFERISLPVTGDPH